MDSPYRTSNTTAINLQVDFNFNIMDDFKDKDEVSLIQADIICMWFMYWGIHGKDQQV